jgi:hypothetical protein
MHSYRSVSTTLAEKMFAVPTLSELRVSKQFSLFVFNVSMFAAVMGALSIFLKRVKALPHLIK